MGRELLLGVHPVREALRARRRALFGLWIRDSRGGRPVPHDLVELATCAGVPVELLGREEFDQMAPTEPSHQGVLLEAGPLPPCTVAELCEGLPESPWLLALDRVEDPQNLGAILRVAEAAGVRGVLVPERHSAPLSPAVGRASAGALEHLPVARVTNLARELARLKPLGFWVHGADPKRGDDLFWAADRFFEGPRILVLGAEGKGLRPGVRAQVDLFFRIPLRGSVASLNVATAAAVFLFEWCRRDTPPRGGAPR